MLSIVGCTGPTAYTRPSVDLGYVERIAIVNLANLTAEANAGPRVRYLLGTAVLASGAFDIVDFGAVDAGLEDAGLAGATTLQATALQDLGKKLNVQAFLVGAVQEFGPVRAGTVTTNSVAITLSLLDAATGKVLWQASHVEKGSIVAQLFGLGEASVSELARDVVAELLSTLTGPARPEKG